VDGRDKPGHDAEGWCAFGVGLGKTYPEPIIAHRLGRERALKAYAKIRAR
jgi:deoxyribodipyrimidine photolyase